MILVVAMIFLGIAVVAMYAYSATPHGGPTTVCGPVNLFGHTFNPQADCRYLSIGELVIAGAFLFLAILLALRARPGR